jgi:hypothetical protein
MTSQRRRSVALARGIETGSLAIEDFGRQVLPRRALVFHQLPRFSQRTPLCERESRPPPERLLFLFAALCRYNQMTSRVCEPRPKRPDGDALATVILKQALVDACLPEKRAWRDSQSQCASMRPDKRAYRIGPRRWRRRGGSEAYRRGPGLACEAVSACTASARTWMTARSRTTSPRVSKQYPSGRSGAWSVPRRPMRLVCRRSGNLRRSSIRRLYSKSLTMCETVTMRAEGG